MNAPGFGIPAVGILYDLPNPVYHSLAAVSKSRLQDIDPCPANYYGLHLDPDREPRVETVGQRAGTLLHTLVLEPETFDQRYAIGPDANRNSKEWKAFEASVLDPVVALKPSEIATAQRQAKSLRAQKEVAELLSDGFAEASLFWRDAETDVLCRCRPDWLHPAGDGWIVLDVKTVPANPVFGFPQQAARMGYDIQAAFYSDGVEAATGKPVHAFMFGNVEDKAPCLSSCIMLHEDDLASGRAKYKRLLRIYKECSESGVWPGFEGVKLSPLPSYARREVEA